jgi:hypothetical protein
MQFASPATSYYKAKADQQRGQMNNLAMRSTQQTMGMNQEKMQMLKVEKFMESVSPALKKLASLPDEQKADFYNKAVAPFATQQAQQYGVDPTKIPPQWNEQTEQNLAPILAKFEPKYKEATGSPEYGIQVDDEGKKTSYGSRPPVGDKITATASTGVNPYNKKMAEDFFKSKEKVPTALKSLRNLETMEGLLDEGMMTGSMSDVQLTVGNFLKKTGLWDDKNGLVKNTQTYFSATAKETANIIKDFGAGTGLSDADREYALKAAGGDITMDEEALRNIIKINRVATINTIANWNQEVDLQDETLLPNRDRFKIDLPKGYMESVSNYDKKFGYTGRSGKKSEDSDVKVHKVDW